MTITISIFISLNILMIFFAPKRMWRSLPGSSSSTCCPPFLHIEDFTIKYSLNILVMLLASEILLTLTESTGHFPFSWWVYKVTKIDFAVVRGEHNLILICSWYCWTQSSIDLNIFWLNPFMKTKSSFPVGFTNVHMTFRFTGSMPLNPTVVVV